MLYEVPTYSKRGEESDIIGFVCKVCCEEFVFALFNSDWKRSFHGFLSIFRYFIQPILISSPQNCGSISCFKWEIIPSVSVIKYYADIGLIYFFTSLHHLL